jgi:hypothetical protein
MSIDLDASMASIVLTFGPNSLLHATAGTPTLTLTGTESNVNTAFFIFNSGSTGFADNVNVVMDSTDPSFAVYATNTGKFGGPVATITLNGATNFSNSSPGVIGTPTTHFFLNNTLTTTSDNQFLTNGDAESTINAGTMTVTQTNNTPFIRLTNNGVVNIATNLDLTDALLFTIECTNAQTNPVTTAGSGAPTTVETITTSSTTFFEIDTRNNATVSGSGPSFGTNFQITTGPLTLYQGSSIANGNYLLNFETDSISGVNNIGALFNAAAVDLITVSGSSGSGSDICEISNSSTMPVSGGATGSKMLFNSATLTNGDLATSNVIPDPDPMVGITGTGTFGAHTIVNSDIILNNLGILATLNSYYIQGSGVTGAKVESTTGSITANPGLHAIIASNVEDVSGTGTIGGWIELPPSNMNGNITLQDTADIPFGFGLTCQNTAVLTNLGVVAGNVHGDSATFGAYIHLAHGNLTLDNSAANIFNSPFQDDMTFVVTPAIVAQNGGIGALIAIDNPAATFSITTSNFFIENSSPMSNFGTGPQLNAAPVLAMSGGEFHVINSAGLSNTASNPTYAAVGNLNLGLNCLAGPVSTIIVSNQNTALSMVPLVFLQNANGAILNIDSSFTLQSNVVLTVNNALSLVQNGGVGSCNGAVLNAGIMTPFDLVIPNIINITNTYNAAAQIGSVNSVGATFNASRNISLISGSQLNLTNNLAVTGMGSLTNSTGAFMNVAGTITVTNAQINLANSGNFTGGTAASSAYTGCHLDGTSLTLQTGSSLNLSNTGSNQETNSYGCRVNVTGPLTILDTSQVNLINTSSTLTSASRGNALIVTGAFDMNGHYLINYSDVPPADATSFGSLIQSTMPIEVHTGVFINDSEVNADNVNVHAASPAVMLAGRGTFGPHVNTGTVVDSHGVVYPGDPYNPITKMGPPTIGTMDIIGTYTQESDGNLFINLQTATPTTGFSAVNVFNPVGTANVDGTVTVGLVPGYSILATDVFNIVVTDTVVNGTYNPTVIKDSSFTLPLTPQIRYITGPGPIVLAGNNIVQLYFLEGLHPLPIPITAAAPLLTSYSFSFETLFDLINRDDLILEREMQRMRLRYHQEQPRTQRKSSSRRLSKASSLAPASVALNQTPSITRVANKIPADGKELAFARYRNEIEQQRMDEEIGCTYQERPWNFFIGPVGDVGTIKTKQNQIGSDYWTAGGLTSFNYVFSQGGIGLFVDYNKVKADVHRHWGNFNFDMAHACLYGTYSPKQAPDLAFHSIVGGSYEWYNIHRKTATNTAKGKTHGKEFDALFTGEYVFAGSPCSDFPENLTIIPRAGAEYIYVNAKRYKEHGASTSDLTIHAHHAKSLRSILDLWIKYKWEWTHVKLTPELNIGWQREFCDKNHKVFFTPLALPTSSVRAFGAGQNTYLAGLDLFLEFYEKYALEASYDFQWNRLIRDNGFYLGFHARF